MTARQTTSAAPQDAETLGDLAVFIGSTPEPVFVQLIETNTVRADFVAEVDEDRRSQLRLIVEKAGSKVSDRLPCVGYGDAWAPTL